MLIIYVTLFIPALITAIAAEHQSLSTNFVKPKRGIVDPTHDGPRDYRFRQSKATNPRSIQGNNAKLSYHKDKPASRDSSPISSSAYEGGFKSAAPYGGLSPAVRQSEGQIKESPYFGNLFTISSGYKVANEAVPVKQMARNPNAGMYGVVPSSNVQVPLYKANYALPKATGPQFYSPNVRNPYNRNMYYNNFQSQPLVLRPVDQFSYPARTAKVNNAQIGAPFLSPLSSFQGQVVPIPITNANPQFPQYKGAAIEIHPTVSGFSTFGYEPLQTQPQLHFGHGNGQALGGHRNLGSAQDIRTDVEIIDKKKPIPPPKNDDDDDDGDDGHDEEPEKEYGPGHHGDDDFDPKPDRQFKPSTIEGDFKPSTHFPFKQYDETFGKYSNQNEEAEEKPFTKYSDYSSSYNEDNEEDAPSGKYHSEGSSSKPFYGKQEDEDEEDGRGYERQRAEDDTYRHKHYEKNSDDDFEGSHRRDLPRQKYGQIKEESESDFNSRSPYVNNDNNDFEDSSGQGSRSSFNYHKNPRGLKDNEGEGSDIMLQVAYEGGFGYKIPEKAKSFKQRKVIVN